MPQVHLLEAGQLNTYDVLVADEVVFTEAALAEFVAGPPTGGSGAQPRPDTRRIPATPSRSVSPPRTVEGDTAAEAPAKKAAAKQAPAKKAAAPRRPPRRRGAGQEGGCQQAEPPRPPTQAAAARRAVTTTTEEKA